MKSITTSTLYFKKSHTDAQGVHYAATYFCKHAYYLVIPNPGSTMQITHEGFWKVSFVCVMHQGCAKTPQMILANVLTHSKGVERVVEFRWVQGQWIAENKLNGFTTFFTVDDPCRQEVANASLRDSNHVATWKVRDVTVTWLASDYRCISVELLQNLTPTPTRAVEVVQVPVCA